MTLLTTFFKRYRKSTDFLLLFFLIMNLIYLGWMLIQYVGSDFSAGIIDTTSALSDTKTGMYVVSGREVHGMLHFKSNRFLDVVFMNKVPDSNLLLTLFSAFIIFQLMRIKSLWYHQRFTGRLYRNIDALGLMAFIMFILARVQERYLVHRITELSAGAYDAVLSFYMTTVSAMLMILSQVLKSFAKQGNILQDENNLTV